MPERGDISVLGSDLKMEEKPRKSFLRIGAYCRVSTDEQARGENNDNQKIEIESYLQRYTIPYKVKWYIEDGYTGTVFLHERPQGRNLLADVLNDQLDQIIIVRIDRLAREDLVFQVIFSTFKQHNIDLISIKEGFDYRTPTGQLMANTFANHASYERVVLLQRFAEGRICNAVKGRWNGGHVSYGYTRDDAGRFIIDSDTSPIYLLIKKMALEGLGANMIRQQLKNIGVPSPTGEQIWSKRTIIYMLKNPFYLGTLKYMDLPAKDDTHPALITQEEFDIVQQNISARGHRGKKGNYHLLSGLIKCNCGRGFAIRYTGKNHVRRYCCQHKYEAVYQCGAPLIDADSLEARVLGIIMGFAREPEAIREAIRAANQHSRQDDNSVTKKQLARLEKQLAGMKRLIQKKDEMYAAGILTDEQYDDEVKSLYERERKLREETSKIKSEIERSTQRQVSEKQYIDSICKLKDYWEQFDPLARQQAIREIISSIQVYNDHLDVCFHQYTIPLEPTMVSRGCWWF